MLDKVIDMENIKLVFIDIDNTLLDFDVTIKRGIEQGFKKHNLGDFTDEMFTVFERENLKLWEALERKEITFQELKDTRFALVFKILGIDFDGKIFEGEFREFIHGFAYPVDGAHELLDYLKSKGYIIAAASNGPYEQQINRLTVGNMINKIDYQFMSEALGVSKPNSEFFDKCIQNIKENISKDECVIIGDSLTSDIKGGKNFGIKTIFFNKHKKSGPFDVNPDYIVNSLEEIKEIL